MITDLSASKNVDKDTALLSEEEGFKIIIVLITMCIALIFSYSALSARAVLKFALVTSTRLLNA